MSAPGAGPAEPPPRVPTSGPTAAVSPGAATAPARGALSERVADAVLAHPDVVRLAGGTFNTITTYLPGRRVVGIALGEDDEPARVGLVVRLGAPVRPTAEAVRRLVAAETGARRVDVVVTDVESPTGPEVRTP